MPITTIDPSVFATWPAPNYINPVTRTWMPGFLLVWQIAATIMVAGRFYLRARKLAGTFGYDDLLIFFGWVSQSNFLAECFFCCVREDETFLLLTSRKIFLFVGVLYWIDDGDVD